MLNKIKIIYWVVALAIGLTIFYPNIVISQTSDSKGKSGLELLKRWEESPSYINLGVAFNQFSEWANKAPDRKLEASPIGLLFKGGREGKYVGFHFSLLGSYIDSVKMNSVSDNSAKFFNGDIGLKINYVLPVFKGFLAQVGLANENWFDYVETKVASYSQRKAFINSGLGLDIMLSFCPIKYIALNVESSAILLPLYQDYRFGEIYGPVSSVSAGGYSLSTAKFEKVTASGSKIYNLEVGATIRPIEVVGLDISYAWKQISYNEKRDPLRGKVDHTISNNHLGLAVSFRW
jgi:hypothetical protein